MICSGVYPFLAIYPPFYEIISGIVFGGQVIRFNKNLGILSHEILLIHWGTFRQFSIWNN